VKAARDLIFDRALIGELDIAMDSSVDLSSIKAEPLPAIRY
jgi:hypothetical protein